MMWKHVSSIVREHSRYEMQEWKYNYFTINFFKLSFKGTIFLSSNGQSDKLSHLICS